LPGVNYIKRVLLGFTVVNIYNVLSI